MSTATKTVRSKSVASHKERKNLPKSDLGQVKSQVKSVTNLRNNAHTTTPNAKSTTTKKQRAKPEIKRSKTQKDVISKQIGSDRTLETDLSDDDEEYDEKEEKILESQENVARVNRTNSDERHSGIFKKPEVKFQSDTLYQPKPKKTVEASSPATIQNEEESVSYSEESSEHKKAKEKEKEKQKEKENGIDRPKNDVNVDTSNINNNVATANANVGNTSRKRVEIVSLAANTLPMTDEVSAPKSNNKKNYTIQLDGNDIDTQTVSSTTATIGDDVRSRKQRFDDKKKYL